MQSVCDLICECSCGHVPCWSCVLDYDVVKEFPMIFFWLILQIAENKRLCCCHQVPIRWNITSIFTFYKHLGQNTSLKFWSYIGRCFLYLPAFLFLSTFSKFILKKPFRSLHLHRLFLNVVLCVFLFVLFFLSFFFSALVKNHSFESFFICPSQASWCAILFQKSWVKNGRIGR
jgi:hypothetical protein